MKIFLLLGLVMLKPAFAEVEKGSCLVTVNGVEHKHRMYMWEGESVVAPISLITANALGEARKIRIIYDYTFANHEMNIKFVDCNRMYQAPGTSMNICSHLFSTRQTAVLNSPFEINFGGQHSIEPEIKVNCLRYSN